MSRMMKEGAKNYLAKPLDVIDFLKMADEFLTNKNGTTTYQ
jgi:ActR/RegA family two-component response regulator